MCILNREQIQQTDAYTIVHEPIPSIELMERAARVCVVEILKRCEESVDFYIFCGMGNNGGDGLAIARLLANRGLSVKAIVIRYTRNFSVDCLENYNKLKSLGNYIIDVESESDFHKLKLSSKTVAIDALFGIGLNKLISGIAGSSVNYINQHFSKIISIDCPSGLFIDGGNTKDDLIVRSSLTLTFQFPKLAFMFSENKNYVPSFKIVDIGLIKDAIDVQTLNHFYIQKENIKSLLTKRDKFSHKGNFGHALLVAGSKSMPGAALLASSAALKSGAGKVSVHGVPSVLNLVVQHSPEIMLSYAEDKDVVNDLPSLDKYNAVCMGPGIGNTEETANTLKKLLHYVKCSLLLDADALNILAENKTWIEFLPPNTILTPHPTEFDRLTQKHNTDFERLRTAKRFVDKHNCILILKGAHTAICLPGGKVYFNSSGNPGLAKAGSGDVLGGIITGLLARGYGQVHASVIGVYVHGYAADLLAKKCSQESICASDLINKLGKAFLNIER